MLSIISYEMTYKNILRLNSVTLGLLWGVIADPGPLALAGLEPVQDEVGYMNRLFFTTVFDVLTTDLHFFTTPPSILTTHPSILTNKLCSLKSEICSDLGLGRHAGHEITISGDALTVSTLNLFPSTTTVGTNSVRVIRTGAASRGACRNVHSSQGRHPNLWASRWAVRRGQTQNKNY